MMQISTYPARAIGLLLLLVLSYSSGAGTLPSGFAELRLAEGLDGTTVNYAPDGRIFVTQKRGIVNVIKNGVMLSIPFLDIQSNVDNRNERGLQSLVFDPNFESNGYIYIYYCRAGESRNRVSRFTANGDVAVTGSESVIVSLDPLPGSIHNGGAMFFKGGKLFITTGDGSNSSLAQSFSSLLGKVLRVNADGTIPNDNPYYSSLSGNFRMIYALGFRNPFRAAVQPGSEKVFINDVGGSLFEEINELFPGKNYGWPVIEGTRTSQTPPANYQDPIYAYPHSQGCSIAGGAFYNPTTPTFPSRYLGKYFFGDYCGNYIKVLDPATGLVTETFATNVNRPISFSVGDDGSFYYLARGGLAGGSNEANTQSCCSEVWRIQFTGTGVPTISAQPTSQTVPIGGSAVFVVGASGDAPLSYQWQRNGENIPGANSFRYDLTNATADDNGDVFRAVISNPLGTITSAGAVLTVSSNLPPVPVINLPAENFTYTAGTTLTFSGSATDPEDGALPASAFTWEINFHHAEHTHPGLPPTSGITGGTFGLSENHDPASDVWYRIYLTVEDSEGQSTTVYRDIYPVLSDVLLTTTTPGLSLLLDGTEVTTPFAFTGVSGIHRTIEAPATQVINGITYTFAGWSDGGSREHEIVTPATNQTLTAFYLPRILEAETAVLSGVTTKYNYVGFTGSGFGDFGPASGAYIEWDVYSPTAGNFILDFRYANGSTADRPLELKINNQVRVPQLSFAPSGGWTTWTTTRTTQQLNAGMNKIRITSIGSSGGNVDHLQVLASEQPVPTVSAPVFSPGQGHYLNPVNVVLSSATSGATIHYTTNGATPTTGSPVYTAPIALSTATTVKAIAVKAGMNPSSVVSASYTFMTNPGDPPDPFSEYFEAEDAVFAGSSVKMNYLGFSGTGFVDYGSNTGAYIEWTVNVPSSAMYRLEFVYANGATRDRPLQILVNGAIAESSLPFPPTGFWTDWASVSIEAQLNSGSNTIRAATIGWSGGNMDYLLVQSGDNTSTPVVSAPVFTPAPGNYTAPVQVTLTSATAGSEIRYTTNGQNPTGTSTLYTGPLLLASDTTIKAIAFKDGSDPSPVMTGVYTFSTSTPSFEAVYEAEDALLYNVPVKFGYAGFTGTGFGDYATASASYIQWGINVPASGQYVLQFRYALTSGNRPLQVDVNGAVVEPRLDFPGTGSWSNWEYAYVTANLVAGENTVRTSAIGYSGGNIDHLKVNDAGSVSMASLSARDVRIIENVELLPYNPNDYLDDHDNEYLPDVEMYPIPVRDILTIRSSAKLEYVHMVDVSGKTVYPGVLRQGEHELQVDINGITPGMSIIMLKAGDRLVSKKVLIE